MISVLSELNKVYHVTKIEYEQIFANFKSGEAPNEKLVAYGAVSVQNG